MRRYINTVIFGGFLLLLNAGFSQKIRSSWMQQEFVQTGREMKAETKRTDCGYGIDTLVEYLQRVIDTSTDTEHRRMIMYCYAHISCPQMISLFEKIILTDTSFIMRDDALMFLGWVDAQSSIPFLLEYYKKQGLSEREKVRIGTTLAVLESWDNATKILDENCYDLDYDLEKGICISCLEAYYMVWNKSSLKYYKYLYNDKNFSGRWNVALRIAEMGHMRTVYNYLRKDLKSPGGGKTVTMKKLSKIGDKKSMKLVENVFKNQKEDIKIREEAWSLLNKNKNKNKNSKQK